MRLNSFRKALLILALAMSQWLVAAHALQHAGLAQEARSEKQDRWKKNQVRVMVCTNAFGMGIDKPDVRLVLHADVPDCLESYYQEAGRAGRDGKKAFAILLYNDQMLEDLEERHKIQYPPLDYIREVYRGVVHYLQVPLGAWQVEYPFDFPDFPPSRSDL